MGKNSLPPGFRFHPTDVELVEYYLKRKVQGKKFKDGVISELDIYKFTPWDLPDKSCLKSGDLQWYFFCPRAKKYGNGARLNRSTEIGFWKTTGKDKSVCNKEQTVGMRRTLVFHVGRPTKCDRTDWLMHEYRLEDNEDTYVLCKIFQKSGIGPRNGAEYGAPFNDEDWDDDLEFNIIENENNSVVTGTCIPQSVCTGLSSEPGPSKTQSSADQMLVPVPHVGDIDILSMLANFTEEDAFLFNENVTNEAMNNANHEKNVEGASCLDVNDIFNGLGDLSNWEELSPNRFDVCHHQNVEYAAPDQMFPGDDLSFLELNDLVPPLSCSFEDGGFNHI